MKSLRRRQRFIALTLVIAFLCQVILPVSAFALTGGPTQPEVTSFEPVGTTEMVDLFSGDFNYNIPLLDVGGYPINIAYHGGITMDQEASWVGLGWNINPGSITRNMRGMPDDFSGDKIVKEVNIKPNVTHGLTAGASFELFGWGDTALVNKAGKVIKKNGFRLGFGLGISSNTYKGIGLEMNIDPSVALNKYNDPGWGSGGGVDINFSSQNGMDVGPSLALSYTLGDIAKRNGTLNGNVGLSYNSRAGFQELTFGANYRGSVNRSTAKTARKVVQAAANHLLFVSGSVPLGNPTYIPQYQMNLVSRGISLNGNAGFELVGSQPNFQLQGYSSSQMLAQNKVIRSGYGYLFEQYGQGDVNTVFDINRDRDGAYVESAFRLPVTNHTYDIYSVSGQGIGTQIRPHRSDVGVVTDAKVSIEGRNDNIGINLGFGNAFKGGINYGFAKSHAWSGPWWDENDIEPVLDFRSQVGGHSPLFEPYYFKSAGELTEADQTIYRQMGWDAPAAVALTGTPRKAKAAASIDIKNNPTKAIVKDSTFNRVRTKRMQNITALNASEAYYYGHGAVLSYKPDYWIHSFDKDYEPERIQHFIPSNPKDRLPYHLGEFTVAQPNGSQYVYGIPAYNYIQKEATFNIGGTATVTAGEATYAQGDNTLGNNKGVDNYYSKTTLPAYAHSYLLTQILSPDYIDRTGNGVTDDDYGTATKINYTRVHKNYHWRVPYDSMHSNYDEGLKSDPADQKGSYLYGEKEVWYVHSIESNNYLAEFYLSKRQDSYGVQGEDGGLNTQDYLMKLDSIALYVKEDRIKNSKKAVPIKVVHFEYNYELCPNVSNNAGTNVNKSGDTLTDPGDIGNSAINANFYKGKLTLKKIYFTYGHSKKGRLNAYKFFYADPDHNKSLDSLYNPAYSIEHYDRWGNYKPNTTQLPNNEYPYVDQSDREQADKNAAAWSLSTIELPSGGIIKVDYEADDYAYVQNKRTMQMFTIEDTYRKHDTNWIAGNGLLYEQKGKAEDILSLDRFTEYLYFKVKLSSPVSDLADFRNKYLKDDTGAVIKHLYYKNLVYLRSTAKHPNEEYKDYVSGYALIDADSCALSADKQYAYIKVQPEHVNKPKDLEDGKAKAVHPVAKAGWQFARLYNPASIFPGSNPNQTGESAIRGLLSAFADVEIMVQGFNRAMRLRENANEIQPSKSWIRLYSPSNRKAGGGARVKRLLLSDQWHDMSSSGFTEEYGQEYEYQIGEKSSGVASYEPMLGNDENPWRVPAETTIGEKTTSIYEHKNKGTANDILYHEEPYGESFFPGASVGYSSVKVRNKKPIGGNLILRTATGYSVTEFYTAKDFPVKIDITSINPKIYNPINLASFIKFFRKKKTTVSQGYCIEINDMHGKPKAVWQYAEGSSEFVSTASSPDLPSRKAAAISGVEYIYRTKNNNGKDLDNVVPVMGKSGQKEGTAMLGVDLDCVVDMRDAYSETKTGHGEFNTDGFIVFIPLLVPLLWPRSATVSNVYRSAVITKVITRTGILEKTIVHDNGASTATQTEVWDRETGAALIQKTFNEYDDPIYTFSYPAHWTYDGMGPGYQNTGALLRGIKLMADGQIESAEGVGTNHLSKYLSQGDQVTIFHKLSNELERHLLDMKQEKLDYGKCWVFVKNNKYYLINSKGHVVKNLPNHPGCIYYLKVVRSGRKNQPTQPVGALVAHKQLIDSATGQLKYTNIVSASAVEYSDRWQALCCGYTPARSGWLKPNNDAVCDTVNPFLMGVMGNWRPKRDYAFVGGRTYSSNPNIRNEGIYTGFTPFWTYSSGKWNASAGTDWQWVTEVTKVSPFGYEVETKDTLGRYSAALYGYNHTLNTAVASNAKYNQIAFDGFEDYRFHQLKVEANDPSLQSAYNAYLPHTGFFSPMHSSPDNLLDSLSSHSGLHSLRITAGSSKALIRPLTMPSSLTTDSIPYFLKATDCIGQFAPREAGKYVLSAWVKVDSLDVFSYTGPSIKVTVNDGNTNSVLATLYPSGKIIEGWQRVEGTFIMPSSQKEIEILFQADSTSGTYTLFDDLRVHPVNASMKSFVYHPVSLRLMAVLDENNYATFYEYDEEGNLVRVKKETYEGIMTIQENRQHFTPSQP